MFNIIPHSKSSENLKVGESIDSPIGKGWVSGVFPGIPGVMCLNDIVGITFVSTATEPERNFLIRTKPEFNPYL